MNGETDDEEFSFISPMQGTIIPLEEVEDQVFSKGLMGEGYAVDLKNSEIIAPFDGEVVMTFPTKHAYGLKRKDGIEVLIHLGMDTVELNGEGFECLVAVGDHVKQGDIIARVDLDYVRKHGKSLVSPIIFTSGQHIQLVQDKEVQLNQDIIQIA